MRLRFGLIPALLAVLAAPGCGGDDGPASSPGTDGPVDRSGPGWIQGEYVGQTVDGYCGGATQSLIEAAGDPEVATAPFAEEPVEGSACNAVVRTYPPDTGTHVTPCSPVSNTTNPPSSGMHYSTYPKFGVYEHAIPRGFWVHALEHGGVTITYSCTDCEAEVAKAKELVKTQGIEPVCCPGGQCGEAKNRMLLTPDPGIPTRWAASGWGFTLTADCFEPAVFKTFAELYRGQGPELICSNGLDVSQPASTL